MADRPSKITGIIDNQTVQQFFDEMNKKFSQSKERWDKMMADSAKKYADKQQQLLSDIADKVSKIEAAGIDKNNKLYSEYKKKIIAESIELEKEKSLEIQNQLYKKEVELSTKAGKEKKNQELLAMKELNEAWIKQYKKLIEEGKELTEEQKEDLEKKEEQVKEATTVTMSQWKDNVTKQLKSSLGSLMSSSLNVINDNINKYVSYQAGFNARIQGSNAVTLAERARYGFNTFGALENRLSTAVGIQPYVKTEKMLSNLSDLVSQGIASNVAQRAFLQTVKDNIATTFDVANSSLLRIVKLQQSDSSAARLGMEAYLTRFLNGLVENTEYLNQTFDNVSDALLEASSQMSMRASTEFEYVVQKWLGALSGTGLSEATSQNIAQAIGYLGSGNIAALNSSSMQNLLVMAASRAGLDYSSLLTQGLNASNTNQLMRAIAEYMVEIGGNSNNVVRSQLAQTFGLSISDLTAAKQLSSDFGKISKSSLGLYGMYGELAGQLTAMPLRMSSAEMIQNMFDNSLFAMSSNVASNPALAALWKVTDMIQSTTGGIPIPTIGVLGNFAGMNATVEQLMKMGIVGAGSLGMIGDVISGLSSSVLPASMMLKLGITPWTTGIRRGFGLNRLKSGVSNSMSALVGNASGADIQESVLEVEQGKAKKQVQDEKEAEQENDPTLKIYKYLSEDFNQAFSALSTNVEYIKDRMITGY